MEGRRVVMDISSGIDPEGDSNVVLVFIKMFGYKCTCILKREPRLSNNINLK